MIEPPESTGPTESYGRSEQLAFNMTPSWMIPGPGSPSLSCAGDRRDGHAVTAQVTPVTRR
jgi:hypothetical protein